MLQARGSAIVSRSDGQKIGTVEDIYLDRETGDPEWALVKTGLFGARGTFVPLAEATMQGSDIAVPNDKDHVKNAPNMDPDGELSQQEEADLYSHYRLDYSEYPSETGLPQERTLEGWDEGRDVSDPRRTTR